MYRVSAPRPQGFSLIELMIGMGIMGTLMALGIPAYNDWQLKSRAKSAAEFYLEGFRTARMEALKHNSSSRLVLVENPTSGQYDWRVDICFPSTGRFCDKTSTEWSSVTSDAADVPDPRPGVQYKSTVRSAAKLPKASAMDIDLEPAGETSIYFNSTGWVNTNVGTNLSRVVLKPVGSDLKFQKVAVAVTLGGGIAVCLPELDLDPLTGDSRRCP